MRLDLKSKLASVFFLWVCAFTLDWPVNATLILLAILLRYVDFPFGVSILAIVRKPS